MLASASAYFLLAFVNIGLVPDGGSSVFVPNRIGFGRAMEMAMLGERIGAEQALAWGLANRVVPDDELADAADALAERLATGPTRAYAATKGQLRRVGRRRTGRRDAGGGGGAAGAGRIARLHRGGGGLPRSAARRPSRVD